MAKCRVYWGSHGCRLDRGHDGPHECSCCTCVDHTADPLHHCTDPEDEGVLCVAKPTYYGPETRFYGEDADASGVASLPAPHNFEGEELRP